MDVITLLLSYFIGINLIGFAMMGIDKYKAKKGASGFRKQPFLLLRSLAEVSAPSLECTPSTTKHGIDPSCMGCHLS